MRALFFSLVFGLVAAFSVGASASYSHSSHSGRDSGSFTRVEYDNFYLYYRNNESYGTPVVEGNSILFFPGDMSVSGRKYDSDTWTTTIAIKPKEGFDINSLTLTEQGDYAYQQGNGSSEGIFDVNARFFIRDKFDPSSYDFLKLDKTWSANEDVDYEDWSVSGSFDISDFSNGFFLTIQNTLTVERNRRQPVPSESNWLSQWEGSDRESLLDCLHGEDWKYLKKFWKRHGGHGGKNKMFLQKKFIGIEIGTTEIPLPASMWLFASALGLVTVVKRKR